MSVKYNDPRLIENRNLPANAMLGVFLAAIKPALEAVHEGWKADMGGVSVTCTCDTVSDRMDEQNQHKVCTKLCCISTILMTKFRIIAVATL